MNLAGITPHVLQAIPGKSAGTAAVGQPSGNENPNGAEANRTDPRTGVSESQRSKNPGTPGNPELTQEERAQIQQLKARDREVRAHEAAHMAAAGGLARGVSYSYQVGPDGQRYAVGGEVGIAASAVPGDPQATLAIANRVRAAAMAPAQPSSQDMAVAAAAAQMAAQARAELAAQAVSDEGEEGAGDGKENSGEEENVGEKNGNAGTADSHEPAHNSLNVQAYAQAQQHADNARHDSALHITV